jgi:hypothetical protein
VKVRVMFRESLGEITPERGVTVKALSELIIVSTVRGRVPGFIMKNEEDLELSFFTVPKFICCDDKEISLK